MPSMPVQCHTLVNVTYINFCVRNKSNGMNYQTLDSLVQSDLVEKVYDNKTIFYFRAVLSDPKVLNITNAVCPGIINAERFDFSYSLLIIYIIFLLAQIRNPDGGTNLFSKNLNLNEKKSCNSSKVDSN